MAKAAPPAEPVFFARPADFRRWLSKHAGSATELLVGFHKTHTGKPCMTWPESVDEALCFGWIDGLRRRIDEETYTIRFTPRRPGSPWSALNIRKAEALIAAGLMKPEGLAHYHRRNDHPKSGYVVAKRPETRLSPAEMKVLRADEAAHAFHEAVAPSYRRNVLWWITSAKGAQTRERRFRKYLAACAAGKRIMA